MDNLVCPSGSRQAPARILRAEPFKTEESMGDQNHLNISRFTRKSTFPLAAWTEGLLLLPVFIFKLPPDLSHLNKRFKPVCREWSEKQFIFGSF